MGTTGLPGRHGTGGGEEGVEVLNLGESMDKGPEAGGGSGGESMCLQSSVGSEEARAGAEARLCCPLWARLRDLHFFLWGKWNNGRISTGGVNPVPGK